MENKISASQAGFMLALLVFSNKIISLPSFLSTFAGGDSIFIILIYFVIELLLIGVFFVLKTKFPDKSFFDVLKSKLTLFGAGFFYLCGLVYFYFKTFLTFFSAFGYFKSEVYLDSSEFIFLATVLIVCSCLVSGGIRSLGRTMQFFFIPIVTGLVLCLVVSFSNYNSPLILFDTAPSLFFRGFLRFVFGFGDSLFLFFIMDKISISRKWKKKLISKIIFTMSIILTGYFLYFSMFKFTGFMHTNAVSDIITLSHELFYLGRVDIVAVVTLMVMTILQLGIYIYIFCNSLRSLIPKTTINFNLLIFNILFLMGYFAFFESYGFVLKIVTGDLIILAILLQYALPIITLFFKRKQKGIMYEKSF